MSEDKEQDREYDRMRGEYLGLMASLELNLTLLLLEWLEVRGSREPFSRWFVEAPIPFRSKVRLYEAISQETDLIRQFGDLAGQMRQSYDFRNTLAHSFRHFGGVTTSKGVKVPAERVSLEILQDRLERLARLDNLILHLLGWEIEGPLSGYSPMTMLIGLLECSYLETRLIAQVLSVEAGPHWETHKSTQQAHNSGCCVIRGHPICSRYNA